MNAVSAIRARVIREVIMCSIGLGILAVLCVGMIALADDAEESVKKSSAELSALEAKRTQLETQYKKVKLALPVYEEILKKNQKDGFMLDREAAQQKLDKLKTQYQLMRLIATISPINETNNAAWRKKNITLISSDIGLKFEALLDEDIFQFMQALPLSLSGAVRIQSFRLIRGAALNDELLASVAKDGPRSLVTGELGVSWLGMKALADPTPATAGKGDAPGGSPLPGGR